MLVTGVGVVVPSAEVVVQFVSLLGSVSVSVRSPSVVISDPVVECSEVVLISPSVVISDPVVDGSEVV